MPRLLKSGEVQLHMPRTGGRSLAKQIGVKELRGTMHDGPGQIPDDWRDYPTVTTIRPRIAWKNSMKDYLVKIGKKKQARRFEFYKPADLSHSIYVDPTFELWSDPKCRLREFALVKYYRSWYDLYLHYFVLPADRIVPIHTLQVHKVEP